MMKRNFGRLAQLCEQSVCNKSCWVRFFMLVGWVECFLGGEMCICQDFIYFILTQRVVRCRLLIISYILTTFDSTNFHINFDIYSVYHICEYLYIHFECSHLDNKKIQRIRMQWISTSNLFKSKQLNGIRSCYSIGPSR